MVLGAGLAGLAATAASLAGQFDRVTIVEGDSLPLVGDQRHGVPQGRRSPAAPRRASRPGRAVARHRRRPPGLRRPHSRCAGHPVLHRRWPSGAERPGLSVCIATRPTDRSSCASPGSGAPQRQHRRADRGRWPAARRRRRASDGRAVRPRTNSNDSIVMDATLVVDATGRRSHTPGWLAELGCPPDRGALPRRRSLQHAPVPARLSRPRRLPTGAGGHTAR